MKWRKYPKYKESGVEWLGEVPDKWNKKRVKFTSTLLNGYAFDSSIYSEEGIPIIRIGDVGCKINWAEIKHVPSELLPTLSRFQVLKDDILLAMTGATIGKNSIYDSDKIALLNQRVGIIRSKKINQRFLHYFVSSNCFTKPIEFLCYGGAQENIGKEDIGDIFITVPENEQIIIASFLDRQTSRIDSLIEKKERQIALLKEKRAALISHAVTKGLDPNVKMKDSGVEWLGEIPAHWEVKKLKYIIQNGVANGLFKKKVDFGYGVKLVNVFDIYREDFFIDFEGLDRVNANKDEQEKYQVETGDIFFVRSSLKLEGVGRSVCIRDITENAVFECHTVRIRPNQNIIDPILLIHFLNSIKVVNRLISLANFVTMATIDQDKIKNIEVPLPPLSEQEGIMRFLNRELEKNSLLLNKISQSVKIMHEYRTALISAAVTGKIDVREEAVS